MRAARDGWADDVSYARRALAARVQSPEHEDGQILDVAADAARGSLRRVSCRRGYARSASRDCRAHLYCGGYRVPARRGGVGRPVDGASAVVARLHGGGASRKADASDADRRGDKARSRRRASDARTARGHRGADEGRRVRAQAARRGASGDYDGQAWRPHGRGRGGDCRRGGRP